MNPLQTITAIFLTLAGAVAGMATWVFEVLPINVGVAVVAAVIVGLIAVLSVGT